MRLRLRFSRISCRLLHLTLLMGLLTVGHMQAAGGLDVTVDKPDRQIRSGGYTTIEVDAVNMTEDALEVRVIRRVNQTPDDRWDISVCSPERCNDSSVDTLEPYMLMAGENGGPKVHVLAGDTGIGIVEIDVITGYRTSEQEVVSLRLSVEIAELPEPALFVRVDSSTARMAPGRTVRFGIFLLARPGEALDVVVDRLETNLSVGDELGWSSRLCDDAGCLPVDSTRLSFHLMARSSRTIFLEMTAGPRTGSTGAVEIAIDSGDEEEGIYHRFILTVDNLSGVDESDPVPFYRLDLSQTSLDSPGAAPISGSIPGNREKYR